ncbi:N-acetyltransferase [Kribbella antibiotica]|uniref:N-acetyltransferase n=1 Tax=Kribbella antibiotica TaxID=190195 RepID=A0A4R4ZSX1_9ACTN|nr:N-acetyltransferase [Kribbella antibiotica]TDD61915.1 N-acetyltransferase [Kribbella antibiotica]
MTWKTRVGSPADEQLLREITLEAFGRQYEVDYLDALRVDPEVWISCVALADEQPVGYAILTRAFVGDTPLLALSPVAVLPAYQRQGAGDAAVRGVLQLAQERPEPAVVVLGHPEYYPRFGFRPADEFGIRHPQYGGPSLMALAQGDHAVPAGPLRFVVEG